MSQTFNATVNPAVDSPATAIPQLATSLLALKSCFSGPAAPATPVGDMLWADTTNGVMNIRNSANTAWIPLFALDGYNKTIAAHATTCAIWATLGQGDLVTLSGAAVTFTAFPAAPQAGARRTIVMNAAHSFTTGANMIMAGVASGKTITLAIGDIVEVVALSTTQFFLDVTYAAGQAWTDVTASRAKGTTYTNTSARPIKFYYVFSAASGGQMAATVGGVAMNSQQGYAASALTTGGTFDIPPGATYSIADVIGVNTLSKWYEYK